MTTTNTPEITALIDRENKVILDWSTKCGCTVLTKMFFRKMGILDEALAYNKWIHEYRMHVFTPQHRVTVEDLLNPDFYKIKVVRNPYSRAVSSYIRLMLDEYIQEDIRRFSWRRTTDITFDRFLDYLETLDLKTCDPHQAYQKKYFEFEDGVTFDKIIKLENLEAGINEVNLEQNLGYDLSGLTSQHHHKIDESKARNVAGLKWSKIEANIPPYRHFYNDELISRVGAIYQPDLESYDYKWEELTQ